ncbi:SusE-like outer membrane protein [Chitinophaga skermanii]|uniref:SusE-like outer membrane protein n=1 Tax=Chitinophaga skermanii TaxID=331697 RepID=A0A327QYX1_9BACT|nr:SusE domain-containing protein [Chitinophaga skermanii]RAJ08822.1 SusE-like outer membrane protein [Chitinophaga skermanii]
MKQISQYILLICLGSMAFMSCKKDEVRTVAGDGTSPTLASNKTTLVLDKATPDAQAITFNWNASSFGFNGVVLYSVEVAKKGTNFADAKSSSADTLTKSFTVSEFNSFANGLGLDPGVAGEVEVRVKAYLSDTYKPAYSNVLTVTVTPYLDLIDYPSIYMPGSHQGWNPETAPNLAAINTTKPKFYEGYVYLPDASTLFKFTPGRKWDGDMGGTFTAGNTGNFGTSLRDNMEINGAGNYYITADHTNDPGTWKAIKANWGIIGNATGSWDVDKDMTYDVASKTWKITLDMVPGEFKFRANDAYDLNFGDDKPADPFLNYNGANIKLDAAGTYEITLNLTNPGNYQYTIKKL